MHYVSLSTQCKPPAPGLTHILEWPCSKFLITGRRERCRNIPQCNMSLTPSATAIGRMQFHCVPGFGNRQKEGFRVSKQIAIVNKFPNGRVITEIYKMSSAGLGKATVDSWLRASGVDGGVLFDGILDFKSTRRVYWCWIMADGFFAQFWMCNMVRGGARCRWGGGGGLDLN